MSCAENTEVGELLEAQAHIWNHTFKFINSMSLKCATELGIPDIIHRHGKPMTLSELINELPINNKEKAPCVYRLMRVLIHSGFFFTTVVKTAENDEVEAYLLTPASKLLLKDEPMTVSPFVLSMLDPLFVSAWHNLSDWFQNDDRTPFATTHGVEIWDLAARNPDFNTCFNEAMASDARLVSRVLIQDYKHVFHGINSLVDVAGGTGTFAKAIACAFPHLKCTVLDLPHVVDGLDPYDNIDFVAGDMFQSIPPADAVLMKWILHDWSDEECVSILKKCKEAIPNKEKGGKVLIIDMVLNVEENGNAEAAETKLFWDTKMMMEVGGKERAVEEWAQIFFKSGFTSYKIHPILGLRSLIEVFY